jgi:hypothetical protein
VPLGSPPAAQRAEICEQVLERGVANLLASKTGIKDDCAARKPVEIALRKRAQLAVVGDDLQGERVLAFDDAFDAFAAGIERRASKAECDARARVAQRRR